jgi:predicted RNA-binding protein with RPS1 domain
MDLHKSASLSIRDMDENPTTSHHKNNTTKDVEFANDDSTAFATEQQQRCKKK